MYDLILFDLDGTVTDPGLGITNSVMYALDKYQIKVAERSDLYRFIGPPLVDSFMEYYGFSFEQSLEAVDFYREYFSVTGLYENKVYPGIPETLTALKAHGKILALATSKPEIYAVQILKHFHLDGFFDRACGSTLDGSRIKKADVIQYALDSLPATPTNRMIMVGDRKHDIEGAKALGIDSIGVTFGYGTEEELRTAGATYIAHSPAEILDYILK